MRGKVSRMYITTREVADMLGVTIHTVRNWARQGKIGAKKIGGRWFVDTKSLEKLTGKKIEEVIESENTTSKY